MKKALLFAAIFLVSAAVACTTLLPTKIGSILENPRNYAEKEVTVSGEVTGAFSLVVVKYFTVKDNTGELAIVTERTLPQKGERIRVKGTIKEAFSLGDKKLIVLIEGAEDRKD